MGSCLSLDQEDEKARARTQEIDKWLQHSAKLDAGIIKILLLGAGESGKSTLVKQMKIIHNDGFTSHELMSFKPAVLENLLTSMKYVLNGMGMLRINLDNAKNRMHAETILACQRCFDPKSWLMYTDVTTALKALWEDAGVRRAVSRGYEYELNDSAIYYFENMERITSEKYWPNQVDVLRVRIRTQGIIETHFVINGIKFRMFDVGGQRSERRKWIHCFADIRAILFVAAISGYDMTLREDSSVNRLEESLRLFTQICKTPFFTNTSMILFLNKLDLFNDKVLHSERHLKYYFHGYTGPDHDATTAAHYIQQLYLSKALSKGRVVYSHFTTATDTRNVQVVFQVVMDTIVRENLAAIQML